MSQQSVDIADAAARRLSRAVAAGDETAFREFFDLYHGRVFRLALAMNRGDAAAAGDVAQAVMLAAARKLAAVKSESHLWNWLARVARQQSGKLARRARSGIEVAMADPPDPPPVGPDAGDELERHLDAALATLDPDEQSLVERFYFDDASQKDIADEAGLTAKAVAGRLDRIRSKLRERVLKGLSHET